jgi:hypothetical protein
LLHRARVLSVIEEADWQTVNVFRRGNSHAPGECPVTLLITAFDTHEDYWWEHLLPNIEKFWRYKVELNAATDILSMDNASELESLSGNIKIGSSSYRGKRHGIRYPWRWRHARMEKRG